MDLQTALSRNLQPSAVISGMIMSMLLLTWVDSGSIEPLGIRPVPDASRGYESLEVTPALEIGEPTQEVTPEPNETLVAVAAQPTSAAGAAAAPVDPHLVIGSETCVKCHENEVKVWRGTPHHRTFDELHRRPEAKEIAAKLGIRSIKHDGRCVNCHYTQQADAANGNVHAIEGVSCESCHGAAARYLDVHHDYGGEHVTRAMESPQHRSERLRLSIELGMRNSVNVYLVAQSCLRCHTTADEELVNVGGHSAGSLEFEFVSWSQGTIRHNFVRTDGRQNDPSSLGRLRLMFVSGMIAELEAGLRATSVATQKAKYGITAAQRTDRAAKRLESVAQKVSSPIIEEIVAIYGGVKLKLNNEAQLIHAADVIATLGYRFASETDPAGLAALDAYIPPSDRWK
ncbi:cytochrome c family protein [Aporhodopirellula aestuarii]|uniref:Cytochrome c family protein n=1 Tax=Aporhodopirellula aestuarii TaxID=2950107 RepID=A0ABT0TYT9_9BACT|nr:cytochrome c family protein [Aporhodopirellula aestuarii]MCM2369549.1 cytochrome c family protein [Aporhodopirellula aestuarii]